MAIPISSQTISQQYDSLRAAARQTQSLCASVMQQLTPGPVNASQVVALLNAAAATAAQATTLIAAANASSALQATLTAYAQQQSAEPGWNVQADLQASLTALNALIAAIQSDYPKDASGRLLDRTFVAGGAVTWISFEAAQLPTTVPAIAAWQATVL